MVINIVQCPFRRKHKKTNKQTGPKRTEKKKPKDVWMRSVIRKTSLAIMDDFKRAKFLKNKKKVSLDSACPLSDAINRFYHEMNENNEKEGHLP